MVLALEQSQQSQERKGRTEDSLQANELVRTKDLVQEHLLSPHGLHDFSLLRECLKKGESVELNFENVERIDSSGAALLALLFNEYPQQLSVKNIDPQIASVLALFPHTRAKDRIEEKIPLWESLLINLHFLESAIIDFVRLMADLMWFLFEDLSKRQIPKARVAYEMSEMGSKAVKVVAVIAFLVGGTMALQSAAQLRQFGANIFVVDLVSISMTRELGPLMAAIVVAGRSGSRVAAEIGTMSITEELAALRTMGVHPTRYVLLPKAIGLVLTEPLLTMLANAAGILGGYMVALFYLDIGTTTFLERLEQSLVLKDILTGLIKSATFAALIVSISAMIGFRTRGGADAVGRSTTQSVVASIFVVICADAFFSLLFYFGD